MDLVNLLQVLDNPLQDGPVLAVLHSPLAGLTVNELASIRLAAKGPYWTALVFWHDSKTSLKQNQTAEKQDRQAQTPGGDQVTVRKVNAFLDRYARWRRLARQSSLSRCLEVALVETQYDTFLLTQPRGEQRHANVQRLLRLAQQFDNFQRQGLFRFLRFIDAQRRAETEPEVRPVAQEDSVRLMSIHQSKGLEFPVVFVADLNKPFNLVDLRAGVILDEKYGVCAQIKPPHTGKRYPSLPYWLAKRRQLRELLGEELRLLYVAVTRARDTLLLFASVTEKRLEALGSGNHKSQNLKDARSFFDWIAFWFSNHYAEASTTTNLMASAAAVGRSPAGASANSSKGESLATSTLLSSGQTRLMSWAIHQESKLLEPGARLANESEKEQPEDDPDFWARLQERLSWQYPFLTATQTPAKASVTTLRKTAENLMDEEVFDSRPSAKQFVPGIKHLAPQLEQGHQPEASAAEIGRVHHRFLQLMSIESATSIAALSKEARRLHQENILSAAELEFLDLNALAAFWNSQLGLKIREHSGQMHRELQFTARFCTRTLFELTEQPSYAELKQEFVVVQGVADLVILRPEDILLVDFKTDAIKPEAVDSRVKLYQPQMELYAHALSQIYQRPVTGCWLYFLSCSQAVEIRWRSYKYKQELERNLFRDDVENRS